MSRQDRQRGRPTRPWDVPWGVVGRSTPNTAAQGPIGTAVDITGSSVTFIAIAGREYVYVPENILCTPSTAGDRWRISVLLDGVQIGYAGVLGVAAALEDFLAPGLVRIIAPTVGSRVAKLQTVLAAGSGTLSVFGTAFTPVRAYVADVGPA